VCRRKRQMLLQLHVQRISHECARSASCSQRVFSFACLRVHRSHSFVSLHSPTARVQALAAVANCHPDPWCRFGIRLGAFCQTQQHG